MGIFDKFKHKKEDEAVSKEAVSVDNVKDTKKEEAKPVDEKVEPAQSPSDIESGKEEKTEEKKTKVKKESNRKTKEVYGILIRPLITEKATNLSQFNQYVFEVEEKANKIQISQAIEGRYGVKPKKINIIRNRGRQVRFGRNTGTTKSWKKAVIILPVGKSLQIHEGV